MYKVTFTGELIAELLNGIQELASFLEIAVVKDGFPIQVEKANILSVEVRENSGYIKYRSKPEFFRGLGLLLQHQREKGYLCEETPNFDTCGLMLDCSRNAVPSVEQVKKMLRHMALMGLNLLMLYTEDTYEVPQQPYFGYMRGRYSQQELRELDAYAEQFGIEMMPCIQTLAHLDRALHWPAMEKYQDTPDVLLVGSEETYALIEQMIVAATAPFKSKRIHIGMDEAYGLGIGKYLFKNGYKPASELMAYHLNRLRQILDKHGLQAMMWSDMHFTAAAPGQGVYHPDTKLPQNILQGAPPNIELVYWDYYHETVAAYDNMFAKHHQFEAKTIFAGGIWTWIGPATDYRKTLAATLPGLESCLNNNIKEVFATAWQDNGAESCYDSILYGLQLFAEYNYTGGYNPEHLAKRFSFCAKASAQSFLDFSLLNQLPGMELLPEGTANPCKVLLFEDPLLPLFEQDYEGIAPPEYYHDLVELYEKHSVSNPLYRNLFEFYAKIAAALEVKCQWRSKACHAVRNKDLSLAHSLLPVAQQAVQRLEELRVCWRELWFQCNKPYGFEVLDLRLGGAIARFKSAYDRMKQFAEGEIEDIVELSEHKLPYLKTESGALRCDNSWKSFSSPGVNP